MTPEQLNNVYNLMLDSAGEAGPKQDYEIEVMLKNGTVYSGVATESFGSSILQVDSNEPGRSIYISIDEIAAITITLDR